MSRHGSGSFPILTSQIKFLFSVTFNYDRWILYVKDPPHSYFEIHVIGDFTVFIGVYSCRKLVY